MSYKLVDKKITSEDFATEIAEITIKGKIIFSKKAVDTFNLKVGEYLDVYYDPDEKRMAFEPSSQPSFASRKLIQTSNNGRLLVSAGRILKYVEYNQFNYRELKRFVLEKDNNKMVIRLDKPL